MTDDNSSSPAKSFSGSQVALFVLITALVTAGVSYWIFRTYISPSDFEPVALSSKEQSTLDVKLRQLGAQSGGS